MKNLDQKNKFTSGWQTIPAGKIFSFIRSHAISRDNLVNGIVSKDVIGNIHYGDIHATYKSPSIDLEYTTVPLVKDKNFSPSQEDLLIDGDLVMADASEDYEGIGLTVSVHGLRNKKVVGGLHTFVLRDKEGQTNDYYRQYIFRNPIVRNKLQKVANGVSVYGISKTEVSKLLLPIPPLPEQNRIVAVLETWDRAIEKLTKKIEIKKNIKKGLMQKLLTGKIRLPGFKDVWQALKLGDVCDIKRGDMITSKDLVEGSVPVIAGGKQPAYFHNANNYSGKTITVSGSGASAGYVNYFNIPIFASDCSVIKSKEGKSEIDFLFYILHNRQGYIYSLQTGGAQPHVYPKDLSKIKVKIPEAKEQAAIGSIIRVSDEEITMLEDKLKKIKDQKKYFLNNLITGAIRTPETMKINA